MTALHAPVDDQTRRDEGLAQEILRHHSKSFALAGRLLPARCRADAATLYAWCRRCDDAVDQPPDEEGRAAAVVRLREELEQVYAPAGGATGLDPVLRGFQGVVRRHGIPRRWPEDLIEGLAMDVGAVRYETVDALLLYAYRAAGVVGLMMAKIMGARGAEALRRAVDLGIGMQLTNVCRDVAEDAARGRVYLPADLLTARAAEPEAPAAVEEATSRAVKALLALAEAFYASGRAGLPFLPVRCAIGIHAAALIYREIGREIARRGFDVRTRAVVSRGRKLWLALRAALVTVPMVLVARRWSLGSTPEGGARAEDGSRGVAWSGVARRSGRAAPPPLSFALPVGGETRP